MELAGEEKSNLKFESARRNRNQKCKSARGVMELPSDLCEAEWLSQGGVRKTPVPPLLRPLRPGPTHRRRPPAADSSAPPGRALQPAAFSAAPPPRRRLAAQAERHALTTTAINGPRSWASSDLANQHAGGRPQCIRYLEVAAEITTYCAWSCFRCAPGAQARRGSSPACLRGYVAQGTEPVASSLVTYRRPDNCDLYARQPTPQRCLWPLV